MLLHYIGDVKDLKRENLLISEKAHIAMLISYRTHRHTHSPFIILSTTTTMRVNIHFFPYVSFAIRAMAWNKIIFLYSAHLFFLRCFLHRLKNGVYIILDYLYISRDLGRHVEECVYLEVFSSSYSTQCSIQHDWGFWYINANNIAPEYRRWWCMGMLCELKIFRVLSVQPHPYQIWIFILFFREERKVFFFGFLHSCQIFDCVFEDGFFMDFLITIKSEYLYVCVCELGAIAMSSFPYFPHSVNI